MIHFHWQSKWRGGGLAPFGGDSFPTQWHSEEAGQNQRSVGLCSEKSCNNLYLTNSAVHVWLQQHSRYSRLTKPTHWLTSKNSIGGAHKTGTHNHQDHEHNCHDKSLDIMHSITGNSNTGSSRLYLLKQHMHNDNVHLTFTRYGKPAATIIATTVSMMENPDKQKESIKSVGTGSRPHLAMGQHLE